MRTATGALSASLLALLLTLPAAAQMAVVDVRAIAQLVQQIRTMQQQLTTAREQLTEARNELQALTGPRGMERLLGNTVRNYLPPDWTEVSRVLGSTSAAYGALSVSLENLTAANAVLTPAELAALPRTPREALEEARRDAALLQVLSRESFAATSARFAALQTLIAAIAQSPDPKAILDLQARIAAEQAMLANEQTKLDTLERAQLAERTARELRLRERAIRDIGRLRALPPMGL